MWSDVVYDCIFAWRFWTADRATIPCLPTCSRMTDVRADSVDIFLIHGDPEEVPEFDLRNIVDDVFVVPVQMC